MQKYDVRATARIDEYYFCEETAQIVVDFFEKYLVHIKGSQFANKNLKLEDWQKEFLINLFSWKEKATNLRRFREAYVEIARKNGKSTICAGVGLYLLYADKEEGAEIYSCASDRGQAGIVFDVAKEMVLRSPLLSSMSETFKNSITYPRRASSYKAISADAYSKHGFNAHGVIFDELHAQPNRDLYDVLLTSTGSRLQPLMISITTAGFDRETICYEKRLYSEKIINGVIDDPTFFPLIFSADENDDWTDPEVWKKANPNLGISISADYLKKECEKAKVTPSYENTFKRLHLNIWTEQDERWLSNNQWDKCAGNFELEDFAGQECVIGLDLSSVNDLTAMSILFKQDKKIKLLTKFWIPEENVQKRVLENRVPYDSWIREGYVSTTSGNVIDYDFIEKEILEISNIVNIKELRIDQWNARQLAVKLLNQHALNVVLVTQGFGTMASPSKQFEALINKQEIEHNNNKCMNWMISNVATQENADGHIRPSKKKSREKIDGVVSTIIALSALESAEDNTNVYNERGLTQL